MLYQNDTSDAYSQHTLKRRIHCAGTGLHSGARVSLVLCPAEAHTGILFRRTDRPAGKSGTDNEIPARWDHVVDTRLCTVIANESGARVGTIEHLMAALAGCGIDNLVIEIDGPEVPIMDGSAEPFLFLIDCAGKKKQSAPRKALRILKPITVEAEGKAVTFLPDSRSSYSFEIAFDSAAIGTQSHEIILKAGSFRDELSRARTFGFFEEVEQLRQMGLARGGSLDNAVVIKDDAILNSTGLRMENEFVRHKLLDAVGDLALCGYPILGRFIGTKAGHALNNQLLRALFADETAYVICDYAASEVETASWSDQPQNLAAAG